MNKEKIARELVKIAKDLVSAKKYKKGDKVKYKGKDWIVDGIHSKALGNIYYKLKSKEGNSILGGVDGSMLKVAKGLVAKPEIDFQKISKQIDGMIDELDDHMNANTNNYDRGTASQIDRGTRFLIEAKKTLKNIDAWDEDPLG